jgi:glutathione S-transferase
MAGGGDLKLLGTWPSPFAIRVKLALDLKGLSYEYAEEDLASKSELLLSSNPVHKKIPVLIHNGVPVCESNIIVEYIDEVFAGPSILSADPYERAIARFWAAYVDDKVYFSVFISLAFDTASFLITMMCWCAALGVVGYDPVQG